MAEHECVLTLTADDKVIPSLRLAPGTTEISVRDYVRFTSSVPNGEIQVTFPDGSPFRDTDQALTPHDINQASGVLEVKQGGNFTYRCRLKTPDGQVHGWPKDPNESGGEFPVRKGGTL